MKALIGKKAPEFHAPAVINGNQIVEDFSLDQYLWEKVCRAFLLPDGLYVCLSDRTACLPGKAE